MGGMAEVQLGQLAQQQALSDQVKQFAQRMVADHGKANDELGQLAGAKGVQVPAEPGRDQRKAMDKLRKLSGAEFDRGYMKHMVEDHKKDVSDFRKQARTGNDAELKAFAAKHLPTLEEHLRMAQKLHNDVKSASTSK
jgi:putative membrane protein